MKLLWPARRLESSSFNLATAERLQRDHGLIWRTPNETYLSLPRKYVPGVLSQLPVVGPLQMAWEASLAKAPWLTWLSSPPWLLGAVLVVLAVLLAIRLGRRTRRARVGGVLLVLAALLAGTLLYVVMGNFGDLKIGPIPEGTPINLLSNLNPDADPADLKAALKVTIHTLAKIKAEHFSPEQAQKAMREEIAPALMKVNKCPDFVMDKGHYFEWFKSMTDEDKYALIELLKTF